MSVSKWAYKPEVCDGDYCPGDCNHCIKNEMEGENINISERMERLAERRAEAFRKLSKR